AVFQYSSEAHIVKGRLESEGIKAFLFDDITIDTDPLISNAIGGVKLKVLSSQENKAIQIINSIKKYSINDNGKSINCPNCDSEKIELFSTVKDIKSLFWFILGMLFSSLPFYTKYKYRCQNCNTEFNLK
ncbi:MAG: DUF2007 domain-containing protein, partial [Bacteroidetes bacterium]|nr:DUF2007 domain-containing protein [Bacteroidota bacterium]